MEDLGNDPKKELPAWKLWAMPFIIGGGMGLGGVLGVTASSEALSREGPAGDLAGALGALIVGLNLLAGFSLALLAIVLGKIMGKRVPGTISTRLAFSILGGVVIGALGTERGAFATTASWSLLLALPVFLAWPRNLR